MGAISYIKNLWTDRVVQNPNDYTKSNETTTSVRLIPAPGTVTQAGTQFTAAKMNNIEQGIYDAQAKVQDLEIMYWMGVK